MLTCFDNDIYIEKYKEHQHLNLFIMLKAHYIQPFTT